MSERKDEETEDNENTREREEEHEQNTEGVKESDKKDEGEEAIVNLRKRKLSKKSDGEKSRSEEEKEQLPEPRRNLRQKPRQTSSKSHELTERSEVGTGEEVKETKQVEDDEGPFDPTWVQGEVRKRRKKGVSVKPHAPFLNHFAVSRPTRSRKKKPKAAPNPMVYTFEIEGKDDPAEEAIPDYSWLQLPSLHSTSNSTLHIGRDPEPLDPHRQHLGLIHQPVHPHSHHSGQFQYQPPQHHLQYQHHEPNYLAQLHQTHQPQHTQRIQPRTDLQRNQLRQPQLRPQTLQHHLTHQQPRPEPDLQHPPYQPLQQQQYYHHQAPFAQEPPTTTTSSHMRSPRSGSKYQTLEGYGGPREEIILPSVASFLNTIEEQSSALQSIPSSDPYSPSLYPGMKYGDPREIQGHPPALYPDPFRSAYPTSRLPSTNVYSRYTRGLPDGFPPEPAPIRTMSLGSTTPTTTIQSFSFPPPRPFRSSTTTLTLARTSTTMTTTTATTTATLTRTIPTTPMPTMTRTLTSTTQTMLPTRTLMGTPNNLIFLPTPQLSHPAATANISTPPPKLPHTSLPHVILPSIDDNLNRTTNTTQPDPNSDPKGSTDPQVSYK